MGAVIGSLLVAMLAASPVAGQVSTPHFRILYTAKAAGSANQLAGRIEAVRSEFEKTLGHDWPGVTEIRLGVGRAELEALALPEGAPPPWAAALAYPERHVVLLDALGLAGPMGEITLRHELCHAALGQLGGPWPRWFHEGLAMNLTGEHFVVSQYAALFRAVTQDRLFHFEDLATSWPEHPSDVEIAYAQSVSFVGWLAERHGPARFGELLDRVHAGDPFEMAFGKAFHSSIGVEEAEWRKILPRRYSWIPIVTAEATLWSLLSLVCIGAWLRRRSSRDRWSTEMEAVEAAEDAALAAELAEIATESESEPDPDPHEPTLH